MNTPLTYEELACPRCKGNLLLNTSTAECQDCNASYPVKDGVLRTDCNDEFMGEFGAEQMRRFIQDSREIGWRRTVEERMLADDPNARTILLDPNRAAFAELFDRNKRNSILDLGAGMGAISMKLSESFNKVYAVDLAFERMSFLRVSADQEDKNGIFTICHQDVCRLPFHSNALDAAVMIGVFEYFPLSYPDESTQNVHRNALSELFRILSPGGTLFIATKNRFGWPYLAGHKDSSHLRFGSIMPRWMANFLSRIFLHRPYRIITDSLGGYTSLLDSCGYEKPTFFWPVNGYQRSATWVDLSDNQAVKIAIEKSDMTRLKKLSLNILLTLGLFRYLVPHYGILATKPI